MTTKSDIIASKTDAFKTGIEFARSVGHTEYAQDMAIRSVLLVMTLLGDKSKRIQFQIWDSFRKEWIGNIKEAFIADASGYSKDTASRDWAFLDKRWSRVKSGCVDDGIQFLADTASKHAERKAAKEIAIQEFLPRLKAFRIENPEKSLEQCESLLIPQEQAGTTTRKERKAVDAIVSGAVDLIRKEDKDACAPYVLGAVAWIKELDLEALQELQKAEGFDLLYPQK